MASVLNGSCALVDVASFLASLLKMEIAGSMQIPLS